MTEEIIIDGVNVAGCCRFEVEQGEPNNTSHTCDLGGTCDGWENCYYKQLKRLEFELKVTKADYEASEQENKRYKQLLKGCPAEDDDCGFCEIDKRNKELEQENKELKAYKDVNEDFKKAWDELNKKYTEVLKLAKENADSNEYCLQELEKENKELKEEKLYRGIDRQFIEDANDRLYFKAEKYRKALEEIKNVLKEICKEECDYTKPKFCGDCDCRYGQILNKINEVLNDRL